MNRGRWLELIAVVCALVVVITLAAVGGCAEEAKPSIASASPASGSAGTEVTIKGSAFGDTQGNSTVEFGTVTADVTSWSDNEIKAEVPANMQGGEYEISVITEVGTSNTVNFEITGAEKGEEDRKQGQIEHETPMEAVLAYCKENNIDTTGMTFSVAKVSEEDPDWKIDVGYKGSPGEGDVYFLLHKVRGNWTVIAHRGETWTATELKELGAPEDLVMEPGPTPAPDMQSKVILDYLSAQGQPTDNWSFNILKVSSDDSNWEVVQGKREGKTENFLLIFNNMLANYEVLGTGAPPWTGIEFKGESVPSDLENL